MLLAIFDDYYSGLQNGLLSGNARLEKNIGSFLGQEACTQVLCKLGKACLPGALQSSQYCSFQVPVHLGLWAQSPGPFLQLWPSLTGLENAKWQWQLPKALLLHLGPTIKRCALKSLEFTVVNCPGGFDPEEGSWELGRVTAAKVVHWDLSRGRSAGHPVISQMRKSESQRKGVVCLQTWNPCSLIHRCK